MIYKTILMLILSILLCSCSSKDKPINIVEPVAATAEVTAPERKAVFTYGETVQDKRIVLTFQAEPVPIGEGYVKLVGIIAGENPLACLEISGKGELFAIGDRLGRYIISSIDQKEVWLCLKK